MLGCAGTVSVDAGLDAGSADAGPVCTPPPPLGYPCLALQPGSCAATQAEQEPHALADCHPTTLQTTVMLGTCGAGWGTSRADLNGSSTLCSYLDGGLVGELEGSDHGSWYAGAQLEGCTWAWTTRCTCFSDGGCADGG